MTNDLTTAVARAICERDGWPNPDTAYSVDGVRNPVWEVFVPQAQAAIAIVVRAAIKVAFDEGAEAMRLSKVHPSEHRFFYTRGSMALEVASKLRSLHDDSGYVNEMIAERTAEAKSFLGYPPEYENTEIVMRIARLLVSDRAAALECAAKHLTKYSRLDCSPHWITRDLQLLP